MKKTCNLPTYSLPSGSLPLKPRKLRKLKKGATNMLRKLRKKATNTKG